jgi:hypothetical protein
MNRIGALETELIQLSKTQRIPTPMAGNYKVNLAVINTYGTDSKAETINVLGDNNFSDTNNEGNSSSSDNDYE